jgi:hypothetical protein
MKIEKFSFGSITIDGQKYGTDVLLLPPGAVSKWWRNEGHTLRITDLDEVLAYGPDVLVVGTGVSSMMRVPPGTVRELNSAGIRVEISATQEACACFNRLLKRGERAAGAFHLTC